MMCVHCFKFYEISVFSFKNLLQNSKYLKCILCARKGHFIKEFKITFLFEKYYFL